MGFVLDLCARTYLKHTGLLVLYRDYVLDSKKVSSCNGSKHSGTKLSYVVITELLRAEYSLKLHSLTLSGA